MILIVYNIHGQYLLWQVLVSLAEYYLCLQFSKSSRLKSFDRFRTTWSRLYSIESMTPMTAAWMPKEMMSEDSEVLMAVSRLVARVLFEPTPKTSAGVAAMVEVLKPKLYQLFGDSQSSNGLLLLRDEQSQLAGMAGVVVDKLPGFQDEVPRVCYLAVDPGLHGQGFGSMLVRQCEDWAKARGHRAIWLFVYRHKERMCQWYSKMGYHSVVTHRTATVPVPGQGKMEGTVQMLGREVTLKRKPLWVNLFVHFMRIW